MSGDKKRSWVGRLLRVLFGTAALGALLILVMLAYLWNKEVPARFDTEAAPAISFSPPRQIVPGSAVPDGVTVMDSNNNVDVVFFDGAYYMGFRTAPHHFAGTETKVIVLRSEDRETWTHDHTFKVGESDMREPRFLVFQDKLFFYFFKGGSNPLAFEPDHIYATERHEDGTWAEAKPIFNQGYVVWRVRARDGVAYMSVYNGAGLYTTKERPGEIRLLTSTDGYTWEPISEKPQVTYVSAEEGEFDFDAEGNLVATVRLEAHGALVCTADKDDLATWNQQYTRDKYDSALMFRHGETFYVIARRNVAGAFEIGLDWLPDRLGRLANFMHYWFSRKRTALYRVDVADQKLTPILDFPSKGDTAFPGIARLDDQRYYVVNYSSGLDGPDWPWLAGQLSPTHLYAFELTMPPLEAD
jgi:hypothetical protein